MKLQDMKIQDMKLQDRKYSVNRDYITNQPTKQTTKSKITSKVEAAGISYYASYISCCNSENWLKSVYIYRSYCKIKTGVSLFEPPTRYNGRILWTLSVASQPIQGGPKK